MGEIFNLKLNADLVVLSSCQTAMGKEINAEGIWKLNREQANRVMTLILTFTKETIKRGLASNY